jgi:hypothetical protein
MVLVMLVGNTAYVMLRLEFYIIQLPVIGLATPPDMLRQLKAMELGTNWIGSLNVCIYSLQGLLYSLNQDYSS